MHQFARKFNYDPSRTGQVGIERECFLLDHTGAIVPRAEPILLAYETHWQRHTVLPLKLGYELSACQLETQIGPCTLTDAPHVLAACDHVLSRMEEQLDFRRSYVEVAPDDMPLDVYPDETGRYQKISERMPLEVLRAACQVIGTHVHVGMPNHETCLRVYNSVVENCETLCQLGDHSSGRRLALYRVVAPNCDPPRYDTWSAYYAYASEHGFANNPRNCWHLIRMSQYGTIEFRTFGATPDLNEVAEYARQCHALCLDALRLAA